MNAPGVTRTRTAPFKSSLLGELSRAKRTDNLFHWLKLLAGDLATQNYNGHFVKLDRNLFFHFNVDRVSLVETSGPVGSLSCFGNHYQVAISQLLKEPDRRFVLAHELAHTLWLRSGSLEPLSLSQSSFIDPDIEYLCDLGAAYLLCPDFALESLGVRPTLIGETLSETATQMERAYHAAASLKVPLSIVFHRVTEQTPEIVRSIILFKIQQVSRSKESPQRLKSRDVFLKACDPTTQQLIVLRKKLHISAVQDESRLLRLNRAGSLEEFCDIFEIDSSRRRRFSAGQGGSLMGSYYRLPDFVAIVMQSKPA